MCAMNKHFYISHHSGTYKYEAGVINNNSHLKVLFVRDFKIRLCGLCCTIRLLPLHHSNKNDAGSSVFYVLNSSFNSHILTAFQISCSRCSAISDPSPSRHVFSASLHAANVETLLPNAYLGGFEVTRCYGKISNFSSVPHRLLVYRIVRTLSKKQPLEWLRHCQHRLSWCSAKCTRDSQIK